jgi:hypothetical protein
VALSSVGAVLAAVMMVIARRESAALERLPR